MARTGLCYISIWISSTGRLISITSLSPECPINLLSGTSVPPITAFKVSGRIKTARPFKRCVLSWKNSPSVFCLSTRVSAAHLHWRKKVTSFSKLQTTSHYFETEQKHCLSYQMHNNIWCWDIVQQSERADYLVPPPSDTRISDGYCLTRGRPITWYIDEGEHSQHWGLQGNHIRGIRKKFTLHVVHQPKGLGTNC